MPKREKYTKPVTQITVGEKIVQRLPGDKTPFWTISKIERDANGDFILHYAEGLYGWWNANAVLKCVK